MSKAEKTKQSTKRLNTSIINFSDGIVINNINSPSSGSVVIGSQINYITSEKFTCPGLISIINNNNDTEKKTCINLQCMGADIVS